MKKLENLYEKDGGASLSSLGAMTVKRVTTLTNQNGLVSSLDAFQQTSTKDLKDGSDVPINVQKKTIG